MRLIDADALFQSYLDTDKQADLIKYEEDKLKAGGNGDFFPGFYTAVMIFRDLINEAPTIGGWISVKERLPDVHGRYLTLRKNLYGGDEWDVLWFGEIKDVAIRGRRLAWSRWEENYGEVEVSNVSHWMPLPEPPEVEG